MFCVRPCRPLYLSAMPFRCCCRAFSSTLSARKQEDLDESAAGDETLGKSFTAQDAVQDRNGTEMTYDTWLSAEGQRWRYPDPLGPKWLGIDVPFPLNPTFKPPIPVSDALRSTIYSAFIANPKDNDLRTLSTRYGISIKRIEAIIRLKVLEQQWKKSKPLQTGFLEGMERLLGLNVGGQMTPVAEEVKSSSRMEVAAADEVSRQITEDGHERKRGLSRTFFESVEDNQQPVVPHLLEQEQLKSRASYAQRPTYPTTIVQPDSTKPAYKFVDVGIRWAKHADRERREKESARRKSVRNTRKGTAAID